AALHFEEWRLRNVDMPIGNEIRKLPIEESQKQRAYVTAIDVGVGQKDHAVITQLRKVEVVFTDAASQRRDQRANFHGRKHLVEAGLLHIQDLAFERQNRLRSPIPALLGGAAGGVALDDEDLGQRRILFLTIGEFAGQTR